MEFILERNNLSDYLLSNKHVDYRDENVQLKADELFLNCNNELSNL